MQKVFASVKAIIIEGNKFLVTKEIICNKTVWDLPGGKIEYGETPEETLKREVKEEIGLDIKIIRLAGAYWFYRTTDKAQIICNTFLCQSTNKNINLKKNPAVDENITGYEWVTKEKFMKKYYKYFNKSIKDVIDNL